MAEELEKITINNTGVAGEPIDINIRRGALAIPIEMDSLEISGNINAVKDYIIGKNLFSEDDGAATDDYRNIHALDSNIKIDPELKVIQLTLLEQQPHPITITGRLLKNPEFEKFKIETSSRWTMSELKRLIRVNGIYFLTPEAHQKLLVSLGKLDVKITEAIKKENDDRGNTLSHVETTLMSNLDESFTLNIPIYKGVEPSMFSVNILFEKRDQGLSIWLESAEAIDCMKQVWDKLIAEQKEIFAARGFTVITV